MKYDIVLGSIPTKNGAIWWVYYCGIVLCFGLGSLNLGLDMIYVWAF